jgi:hypothetical protein
MNIFEWKRLDFVPREVYRLIPAVEKSLNSASWSVTTKGGIKTSFYFRGCEAFILLIQKLDLERFEVSFVAFDFGSTDNCLVPKSPFSLSCNDHISGKLDLVRVEKVYTDLVWAETGFRY